jgi:hypothetical protein
MLDGSSSYEEVSLLGGESEMGIEVACEGEAMRKNTTKGPIFDDALDALMVMCMAFDDLETRIEDNNSYAEDWNLDAELLSRQIRKRYDVEKAFRTFTYYDSIRRGIDMPPISDLSEEDLE